MSDSKVYEMQWDCQFCGTERLLGKTHRFCPNCGAAQDPKSRYYPADEDKVAVEDHEFVGVDVTCPACAHLNSAASSFCEQCGSPLEKGAKATTLEAQVRAQGGQFESSGSRDVVKEAFDAEMERVGVTKSKNGGMSWKVWLAIGVMIAVCGGIFFLLTAKQESMLVVTGHNWERNIIVEQYQNIRVKSWEDSQPAGINMSIVPESCSREERSTRRVPDGEECSVRRVDQGDGTFREETECRTKYREEPVYDQMCTWTGFAWDYVRTANSVGLSLVDAPAWAETNLNCANSAQVGCERIARRDEVYTVTFTGDEGKTYTCEFDQAEWESIPDESVWVAEVGRFNDTIDCDSLVRR